jgi:hypothetical protein
MPAVSFVILVVGVLVSVAGMVIVRRFIPAEKLSENNDYVGFTFSILSLVYGIYLAFTVVVVWQQYEGAKEKVMTEVALLGGVWRTLEPFDVKDRVTLRRDMIDYTRDVIVGDFPKMERGLAFSASPKCDRIWTDFYAARLNAADARQGAFYTEALARLNEFTVARRQRILASNASLPTSMWILLIIGAVGTIVFTWFYGTHYLSIQIAATTFLSAVIIYSVLLVGMLEYPFGSGVRVGAGPYIDLLQVFETRMRLETH